MDTSGVKRISAVFYGIIVFLVLSYLVVLSVFPVNANDVFLYLEIGRRFFSHEGLPTTDVFRYTGVNAVFDSYHELGSMLVYYLAYVAGGFNALILVKSLLLLAMGIIPFWVAWKLDRQRHSFFLPVMLFFAIYGASWRFIERGSLFSDLFSTLLVSLIILIRAKAGNVAMYRASIPLVFLAWVNIHAGHVIGFLILILWLLAELLQYLFGDEQDRSPRKTEIYSIAKTIIGSVVLGLLNPRGVFTYSTLARTILETRWSVARATNPEFMSPFAKGFLEFLDMRVFIGVMLACCLLVIYAAIGQISKRAYRDLPIFEALCLCVFTCLGFIMVRFVLTASFGAVVIAAALLANNKPRFLGDGDEARPFRLIFPAMAALSIAGCLFAVAAHGYGPPYGKRRIGLGINMAEKPVQACDFIDKTNLSVNIFNRYEYGGYMIWRWQGKKQVFVHGFTADTDFIQQEYMGISRSPGNFTRIVSKNKIGAFLIEAPFQGSSSMPEITHRLMTDSEWHLVYSDAVAVLFVKDVPENREIIEHYSSRTTGQRGH